MELTADQMMLAIERGVEKAMAEKIGRNYSAHSTSHELFIKAIERGASDSITTAIHPIVPAMESCEEQHCRNCRFYTDDDRWTGPTEGMGLCRRHPPTSDSMPEVDGDDWCGEWKPVRKP
jgi:hypothetical protein